MEQKSRLDKAIVGLTKILELNKDFKNITIDSTVIQIRNSKPEFIGTLAYLVIILILPTGLLIYEYVKGKEHSFSLILLVVFLFLFGRDLYKIVRGEKVTVLDLKAKQLEVENVNGIFGKLIEKQKIAFQEISKIELVDNAIYHRYSSTKWSELTLIKKNGQQVILASFTKKYPESFIAERVKFLLDVIIWTEKKQATIL